MRLSFYNKLIFLLKCLVVCILLLAYPANFISPESIWWVALFGLGYPFIIYANLIFILYWGLLRKKLFLLSTFAILVGFNYTLNLLQFNFNNTLPQDSHAVKIMSFNVHLFDVYNWKHNKEGRLKIYKMLGQNTPDIACFQEFYTSNGEHFNNMDSLIAFLNDSSHHEAGRLQNIHFETTFRNGKDNQFGIATFSGYPIINKGRIPFPQITQNICIFSDIKIGNDTLRVYNMHLQSIRFAKEDYHFIEKIEELPRQEEINGSNRILKRLRTAFILRAQQVDIVAAHIRHSPYPVIVCGDFNDSPSSYTYNVIANELKDSFAEAGYGFGKTYAGPLPSFRIDYILHDQKFSAYEYRTIR